MVRVLFFLSLIGSFQKKYAIISEEEFENLNVVKPNKNNVFWSVIGSSVLFGVTLRKYIHVFDVQLDKLVVMILCALALICVIVFYFNLNRKLKLKVFDTNIEKNKRVILIPTFKLGCFFSFRIYFRWKFFNIFINCPYDNRTSKYNNIYLLDYDDNAFLFVKYDFDR